MISRLQSPYRRRSQALRAGLLTLLTGLGLVAGCGEPSDPLQRILERGELRFITRNAPSTYYIGRDGPTGFEFDLAQGLAEELGVELVVKQAFRLDEIFAALRRGEADIAGAGLSLTSERRQAFASSIPYATQNPQVIYKAGQRRPRSLAELAGLRVAVMADSSHESLLARLHREGQEDLAWDAIATSDVMELLVRVRDDLDDVAVVDSRDFLLQQRLVPRLDVAFNLEVDRDIVWFMAAQSRDSALLAKVNDYLSRQHENGRLAALTTRHFQRDEDISRIDSQTFVGNMRSDLRHYRGLIEHVAREHQMPWELLAAISYQESHWDPQATSRTGVRGMMMLTLPTAEEMGVADRTDPEQSLRGGARYFKSLRRRLPEDIFEPDRTWLALAAYNIGMAHLEDARVLTERRGGDPHLWRDVMEALPLLEESQYYRNLKYGYARGLEAVRYVQNIRHYYDILRWQTAREARPRPPSSAEDYLPESLLGLKLLAL
jgi:membrane-bound lytic murein transglycosylase F